MSTFKFNFSSEKDEESKIPDQDRMDDVEWYSSEEVKLTIQNNDFDEKVSHAKMFVCGDVEIGHVLPSEVLANLDHKKNKLQEADCKHSDLIPGCYEGGLKIWECTTDLLTYLIENEQENKLESKNVLDLGCGAGILGIYAFMHGSCVTFQDYNKEVIESVTIPNVLLNIEEEQREQDIKKCRFYTGDWASFNSLLSEDDLFDVILTSETIYNISNQSKLVDIFTKHLKNDGVIYVAAKTYYFGVGGGTRQFEKVLEKTNLFDCDVCWKCSEGVQREILKIKRKS